jgi:hypothetical protein
MSFTSRLQYNNPCSQIIYNSPRNYKLFMKYKVTKREKVPEVAKIIPLADTYS